MISVDGVRKSYGRRSVLEGVSLALAGDPSLSLADRLRHASRASEPLGAEKAGATRAELLLALVGAGDRALVEVGARVVCVGRAGIGDRRLGHQVCAPLNCTGMRPIS